MNTPDYVAAVLASADAGGIHNAELAALRRRLRQLADPQAGLLPGAVLEPLADLPRLDELPEPPPGRARDVLGRLVVVKLNGGLGTSMGLPGPKSLLQVKPGPQLEWCPPGHGDIYTALAASGTLDALLGAGLRYAFVSNSNNLGALAEARLAAWLAAEQVPFAIEAVRGTPADRKGGHLARYRDRVVLRETAQVPSGDTSLTDVERWRWYNTNNIWIDLRALAGLQATDPAAPALPLIVNHKTVDPREAASTPVIQLESAMGAATGSIPGARALHVPRSRFAPVNTTDNLLAVRSDAYQLTSDGQMSPSFDGPGPVVTLDKDFCRLLPGFEQRFPRRGTVAAPLPPVPGRRRRHLRQGRRSRGRRAGGRPASHPARRGTHRKNPNRRPDTGHDAARHRVVQPPSRHRASHPAAAEDLAPPHPA